MRQPTSDITGRTEKTINIFLLFGFMFFLIKHVTKSKMANSNTRELSEGEPSTLLEKYITEESPRYLALAFDIEGMKASGNTKIILSLKSDPVSLRLIQT
jgi:hypothetical protein